MTLMVKRLSLIAGMLLLLIGPSVVFSASTTVPVTGTVLSKGKCTFNTHGTTINFGTLDPANPVDKTITASIVFRCQANGTAPLVFDIIDNYGLNETAPGRNRMRLAATTDYLNYTFTYTPSSGSTPKNTNVTVTMTGKVFGSDYQDAVPGSYSDTVTMTLNP